MTLPVPTLPLNGQDGAPCTPPEWLQQVLQRALAGMVFMACLPIPQLHRLTSTVPTLYRSSSALIEGEEPARKPAAPGRWHSAYTPQARIPPCMVAPVTVRDSPSSPRGALFGTPHARGGCPCTCSDEHYRWVVATAASRASQAARRALLQLAWRRGMRNELMVPLTIGRVLPPGRATARTSCCSWPA